MRVKIWLVFSGLLLSGLQGEILHLSRLNPDRDIFSVKRNLFSPEERRTRDSQSPAEIRQERVQERVQKQPSAADLIRRNVTFEGYVIKNQQRFALMNVGGDYLILTKGEYLLEHVKILKIEEDRVLLDTDSGEVVIPLKGDQDD